ncbi:MAG TPA: hypothetical protein VG406_00785 [Isosphaeraceae bacterium]|jgi:hypothetical protein|nr:hypothetical protein [Isosphaeraceae bacterium]
MALPAFVIGEWLVCPKCEFLCDSPFQPAGSNATEPELVLGASLPKSEAVSPGDWSVEVAARCPACGTRIAALAVFEGRVLRAFTASDAA